MIIKEDIETIQDYLKDESNFHGSADRVVIPNNRIELLDIIKKYYNKGEPFTISGAGTGLTGGRCPNEGTIISTENLNRIIEVDCNKGLARVEPGVLLKDFQEELAHSGYFLPPNPTENSSSIGGNISTNASGSRSFKYGSYRNFVEELSLILVDGTELNIKRGDYFTGKQQVTNNEVLQQLNSIELKYVKDVHVKNASGYFIKPEMDIIDLFIGSEGTLAVVSEAVLRFYQKPEAVLGFIVFFENTENMLKFVDEVRLLSKKRQVSEQNTIDGISARLIEFFDLYSLRMLSDFFPQIPNEAQCCIWIEQECNSGESSDVIEEWYEIIRNYSNLVDQTWFAQTDAEHERFRKFRHQIPLLIIEKFTKNGFRKIGTDTAVPECEFHKFYYYIKDLFDKSGIESITYGHIGDCHLHANLLPKTRNEFEKSLDIYNLIINKAVELNGTVSAEHGIGKLKKKNLELMYGTEGIDKMKSIKKLFDPDNLLGRGNIFDL